MTIVIIRRAISAVVLIASIIAGYYLNQKTHDNGKMRKDNQKKG